MTTTLALPHTHARFPLAWRRTHAELFELPARHVHVHGTKGTKRVPRGIPNGNGHIPDTFETVVGERADSTATIIISRGFLRPNGYTRQGGEREQ